MAVWTEKRAYNRFVHREPIGYAFRPIEKFYRAEMVNASEGGAHFKSAVTLRPGQNIYVRIENLSEDAVLPEQYAGYHAEVRYCKKLGKADARFYGIGVQYLQKLKSFAEPGGAHDPHHHQNERALRKAKRVWAMRA